MKGTQEAAWLTEFLNNQPDVTSARIDAPLRISPGSWVFSAHVNDAQVVVKRFIVDDPVHAVTRLRAELSHLETAFDNPQYRANRCLMAWPEDGVVVLSFAAGERLDEMILSAKGAERATLFEQSGAWLRQYSATRKRQATFGPRFWVKKLDAVSTDPVTDPADQELAGDLLQNIRGRIEQVKGVPLVQAATHGDFVGMNMHIHDGIICGVDIQGESWLPLARDAARFLVWSQIHDPARPSTRRYGIAAQDLAAFLRSDVLDAREVTTTLPFFIGEQLYLRLVENCHRRALRDNMRAAIHAYLTGG
ncbi:hypothetical protein [Sulfitobacter sp. JB4-11]|uniref:hypothetical protein n=1 Tax=Sulfitobacter rhodophyticola TaxID=3238304 RepID=UPI0035183E03